MNSRPMPTTLYTGPIISLKSGPVVSHSQFNTSPSSSGTNLQRRPYTRRTSSVLQSDLSPVSEEDEAQLAEDESPPPMLKSRRRPRPAPLIPPRASYRPELPILSETPDSSISFQEELQRSGFALSPSTLLDRRPSETLFDFPIPPASSPIEGENVHPIQFRHSPSPTSSNASTSSSCCLPTPQHSDDEVSGDPLSQAYVKFCSFHEGPPDVPNITFLDLDNNVPTPSEPHFFRRTASSMSLRSFGIADLNTYSHVARPSEKDAARIPIHNSNVAKEIQALRAKPLKSFNADWVDISGERKGRLLSVVDTVNGSSFDVPLVLGSFVPYSPDFSDTDSINSDREDILDVLVGEGDEHEDDFIGTALSSSDEEEDSDIELFGPSRALDPVLSASSPRRRRCSVRPIRPDTPSIYSMASFSENPPHPAFGPQRLQHGISADTDVHPLYTSEFPHSPIFSSSCNSPLQPELRSRFSSSTLGSISEPTSTTSSFFARLNISSGRSKQASRRTSSKLSTTNRSPSHYIFDPRANSSTMYKASCIPTSPTPSSFSFSSRSLSDRERDYADDTSSCISGDSAGSNGLKRPPIPIELFIRA